MSRIFFTSDLHLQHDRDFLFEPRGFKDILTHDITIINNINSAVNEDDELYILGDLMLNDIDYAISMFNKIKCKNIHVILGNHDTPTKIERYKLSLNNVKDFKYADLLVYKKYKFFLSHFPTIVSNSDKHLSEQVLNLFGHTHSKEKFYQGRPYMYNVSLDANDNKPILIDDILEAMRDMKQKVS